MKHLFLFLVLILNHAGASDDDLDQLMQGCSGPNPLSKLMQFSILDSCQQDASIKTGTSLNVKCKIVEPDCMVPQEINVDFTLRKDSDELSISLPLTYTFKGAPDNKIEVLNNLQYAKECAIKFYARHGLNLELNFKESDSGRIKLWDDLDVVDDTEWAMISKKGKKMTQERICGMVTHELSHHLGLNDGYAYFKCPKRKILEPNNIMHDSSTPINRAILNSDQIDQITKVLCRKASCG